MTTPNHPTGQQPTAWHTYLTATHAARDHYLNITHQAHLMLLTGPFPDRDGYQRVEHQAWDSYYAAARTAWQHYTATLTCPCCTTGGNDCTCRTDCGNPRCQMADPPLPSPPDVTRPGDGPWLPPYDRIERPQPTYTPTDGGTR